MSALVPIFLGVSCRQGSSDCKPLPIGLKKAGLLGEPMRIGKDRPRTLIVSAGHAIVRYRMPFRFPLPYKPLGVFPDPFISVLRIVCIFKNMYSEETNQVQLRQDHSLSRVAGDFGSLPYKIESSGAQGA